MATIIVCNIQHPERNVQFEEGMSYPLEDLVNFNPNGTRKPSDKEYSLVKRGFWIDHRSNYDQDKQKYVSYTHVWALASTL